MQTVVHVTHEAIQKIGGIGAVLQGLLTSKTYLDKIHRNILVGPFWPGEATGDQRLGTTGEVLYSSIDNIYRSPLTNKLRDIEHQFGCGIIYGRRRFVDKETGIVSVPEVLLFDVSRYNPDKIGRFKYELCEHFGIDSNKYQHIWDYEQYLRIAQPAIACLQILGAAASITEPCVILSHEYMGMPTALAAILETETDGTSTPTYFRTIFHAHEVATMRRIVEHHAGHDTMFYNAMRTAMASGHYVEDVFGDQHDYYKHALVKQARFCDEIFGVGDYVLKEIQFMGPDFANVDASLAYNGVPHWPLNTEGKMISRNKLRQYCKNLLKFEPDFVFTHVTRLVPSKGLWRDLKVLEHLEPMLRERGETAVLFTLSTEAPPRRTEDVRRMEAEYHWPVVHREGGTDLSGGEAAYYAGVQEFNAISRNIKVVFINQFGFDPRTCGTRMPADMEFMDIRKGSDVEFGQSIYEPFGIAQVEPISFGGICIYTNVCGCAGFVDKAAGGQPTPNAIVADYTELPQHGLSPAALLGIGKKERGAIEHQVAEKVAAQLVDRLPRTPQEIEVFLQRGQALANNMSWEVVARDYVLPGIERASRAQKLKQIA
jgi:hypothetical protein